MFETISMFQILAISSTALITSAITAFIGAGGGTILLLVMLYILPAPAVIPIHGCIQLMSNTTRVSLMWKHMQWPIIFRFMCLMPIGVYLGLQLYSYLEPQSIQLIIAISILLSLFVKSPKTLSDVNLPKWAYYFVGLGIGFGNMIVGVLAPLLAAILRLEHLTKEQTVGTLGFFGFIGNILKIAGFSLIGFSFAQYLPLIIPACLATIFGNILGKSLLQKSSNHLFQQAFKLMIILLSAKMIWDVLSA